MDQEYWEQLALDIDLANNLFVPPEDYVPDFLDTLQKETEQSE